jgi:hypothetical protein
VLSSGRCIIATGPHGGPNGDAVATRSAYAHRWVPLYRVYSKRETELELKGTKTRAPRAVAQRSFCMQLVVV